VISFFSFDATALPKAVRVSLAMSVRQLTQPDRVKGRRETRYDK